MLPKISGYVKSYDGQTKWMYFLIENDELLEKYNTIWDKDSADIEQNLIATCLLKKLFKTKAKSYGDKVTDLYDKNSKGGL